MEINESNVTKKSHNDQVAWSGTENHDHLLQSSSSKSYVCSFCKKGFSNAQALGGHMNIHRRDRAKLRQAFADEVLLSLDITSSASNSIHHHHGSHNSDDKIIAEANDDHRRNEDDAVHPYGQKIQKQPFFVDANLESSERSGDEKIQNETLDLELRLGPEPHDTSGRSRREFF